MDLITSVEIIAVVVVAILIVYVILKWATKFAVTLILNAIGGILILLVSNYVLTMGIPYNLPTILVCALGGVPGAIVVDILMLTGTVL
jgi:inhibitor of the pro-sigma K processing machinery